MKGHILLAVFALFGTCRAHLCLVHPVQRGGYSEAALNTAGHNDCLVASNAPCGTAHKEHGDTIFQRGKMARVTFQKNLDHWDSSSPGYFQINLVASHGATEIGRIDDAGEKSLYEYSAQVAIPNTVNHGDYALQVIYVTNNAAAPPYFYQCADVTVQ